MEEKAPDALEVAAQENEARKETKNEKVVLICFLVCYFLFSRQIWKLNRLFVIRLIHNQFILRVFSGGFTKKDSFDSINSISASSTICIKPVT